MLLILSEFNLMNFSTNLKVIFLRLRDLQHSSEIDRVTSGSLTIWEYENPGPSLSFRLTRAFRATASVESSSEVERRWDHRSKEIGEDARDGLKRVERIVLRRSRCGGGGIVSSSLVGIFSL